jgi:hypothetical protein
MPTMIQVTKGKGGVKGNDGYTFSSGYVRFSDSNGRPCTGGREGELVAVNIATGKIAWNVPLGTLEDEYGENGKKTGATNIGPSLVTRGGVVFIGAATDERFHAYDSKTGKLLWQTKMSTSSNAGPMTYVGKDGPGAEGATDDVKTWDWMGQFEAGFRSDNGFSEQLYTVLGGIRLASAKHLRWTPSGFGLIGLATQNASCTDFCAGTDNGIALQGGFTMSTRVNQSTLIDITFKATKLKVDSDGVFNAALAGGVDVRVGRAVAARGEWAPGHLRDAEVRAGLGLLDQQDRVAHRGLDIDLGAGGHRALRHPTEAGLDRLGSRDVEVRERLSGRVVRGRGEIAVAKVGLRGAILSAGPGTEEGGKCDGDQEADNEYHHHELDERESRFLVPAPLRGVCGHPGLRSFLEDDGRSVLKDLSACLGSTLKMSCLTTPQVMASEASCNLSGSWTDRPRFCWHSAC